MLPKMEPVSEQEGVRMDASKEIGAREHFPEPST